MGNGDLLASIKLREGDMFQQEATAMDQSLASLRDRVAKIKSMVAALQSAAEPEREALIAELQAEMDTFETDKTSCQ